MYAALGTLVLAGSFDVAPQAADELKVGHWVEVRGELDSKGRFRASKVEAMPPQDKEILLGIASDVRLADGRFRLLGRTVVVSDKTQWKGVSLAELDATRVKVEGHWRGGDLFSARDISVRKEGRDHVSGRIDEIEPTREGLELQIQGFTVLFPTGMVPESQTPLAQLPLAPEPDSNRQIKGGVRVGREEWVPMSLRLTDDLSFGALIEYKAENEDNFDLDDDSSNDELKQRLSVKGQLGWTPSERFHGLVAVRVEGDWVSDEDDPDDDTVSGRLDEGWGYWSDLATKGLDLQVGRMPFEDTREWIYRHKLDGARLFWGHDDISLELSATTVLSNGSEQNEDTQNLIGYLFKGDRERELGLWVVDRRDDSSPRDYPIQFGARALGAWVPENDVWADFSLVRGFSDNVNLKGWASDVGTTWSPPALHPFSFTAGWALGSGDDPSTTDTDESYRQTGLQRNNGRFAGVTSFRYYGEIIDPELSNLSILTLGIGTRLWRRSSIDLVWHAYHQMETVAFLGDVDIDATPDGSHSNLGQELDLVLGSKDLQGWHFEVVLGWFDPGAAFVDQDPAWLSAVQLRYRF